MNRVTVTLAALKAALGALKQGPRLVAWCPAGIARAEGGVELFGTAFTAVPIPGLTALEAPAIVLTLVRPGQPLGTNGVQHVLETARKQVSDIAIIEITGEPGSLAARGTVLRAGGQVAPLDEVRAVGPSMGGFGPPVDASAVAPAEATRRWSRIMGSIGIRPWRRLVGERFAIVGCGRSGSLVATGLARMGVTTLALIDPDRVELHNLDAMDGAQPADVGRHKAVALADSLGRIHGRISSHAIPTSVSSTLATRTLQSSDVILCCVDDDGARWIAGVLATLHLRPFVDLGAGVFGVGDERYMGADVRLVMPGEGCVQCFGAVSNPNQVAAMRRSHEAELRSRLSRRWHQERSGSLRSLNQVAAGLALRLVEDLYSGHLRQSAWLRLSFPAAGPPTLESLSPHRDAQCAVCALSGRASAGLATLSNMPLPFAET